jgi:hypothetical protein
VVAANAPLHDELVPARMRRVVQIEHPDGATATPRGIIIVIIIIIIIITIIITGQIILMVMVEMFMMIKKGVSYPATSTFGYRPSPHGRGVWRLLQRGPLGVGAAGVVAPLPHGVEGTHHGRVDQLHKTVLGKGARGGSVRVVLIAANGAHQMTWCCIPKLCINSGEGQ